MKDEELMKKFVELFGENYVKRANIYSWAMSLNREFDYYHLNGFYGLWNKNTQNYILWIKTKTVTIYIL